MRTMQFIDDKISEGGLPQFERQLMTFGIETMAKLMNMEVLVSGLRGVGIEAAKNLILLGVGSITIHDNAVVQVQDLGSNFYLSQEDVGNKTRAEA